MIGNPILFRMLSAKDDGDGYIIQSQSSGLIASIKIESSSFKIYKLESSIIKTESSKKLQNVTIAFDKQLVLNVITCFTKLKFGFNVNGCKFAWKTIGRPIVSSFELVSYPSKKSIAILQIANPGKEQMDAKLLIINDDIKIDIELILMTGFESYYWILDSIRKPDASWHDLNPNPSYF